MRYLLNRRLLILLDLRIPAEPHGQQLPPTTHLLPAGRRQQPSHRRPVALLRTDPLLAGPVPRQSVLPVRHLRLQRLQQPIDHRRVVSVPELLLGRA